MRKSDLKLLLVTVFKGKIMRYIKPVVVIKIIRL